MKLFRNAWILLTFASPFLDAEAAVPVYPFRSRSCGQVCKYSQGSCTVIRYADSTAWVLTVGHTVSKLNQFRYKGRWHELAIVSNWKLPSGLDSAVLLKTTEPLPFDHIPVITVSARGPPQPGEGVSLYGYPFGKARFIKATILEANSESLLVSGYLAQGASGGICVFHYDRSLAGLIVGYETRSRKGIILSGQWIRSRLTSEHPELVPHLARRKTPITAPEPIPDPISTQPDEPVPDSQSTPVPDSVPPSEPPEASQKPSNENYDRYPSEQPAGPSEASQGPLSPPMVSQPSEPPPSPNPAPPVHQPSAPKNPQFNIPFADIFTQALKIGAIATGVAAPPGLAGLAIWAGLRLLRRRKKGGPPEGRIFRDLSEARQILSLRQWEQREPVLDALRGILFEDELAANPDQSLKDAAASINRRFNDIAPPATQHTVQQDTRSE